MFYAVHVDLMIIDNGNLYDKIISLLDLLWLLRIRQWFLYQKGSNGVALVPAFTQS